MNLKIKEEDYPSVRDGTCFAALNPATSTTEYVSIFRTETIQEWPKCMQDNTFMLYAAGGGVVGFIVIGLFTYWITQQYKSKPKAEPMSYAGMDTGPAPW